jgi:hypothetical protein
MVEWFWRNIGFTVLGTIYEVEDYATARDRSHRFGRVKTYILVVRPIVRQLSTRRRAATLVYNRFPAMGYHAGHYLPPGPPRHLRLRNLSLLPQTPLPIPHPLHLPLQTVAPLPLNGDLVGQGFHLLELPLHLVLPIFGMTEGVRYVLT